MERAAGLIRKTRLSRDLVTEDDVLRSSWPTAAGKIIAAHTNRIRLVRKTMVVEVEDAIWQRQLYAMRQQILNRVRRYAGEIVVEDIEFRVGIPRRQPQRAISHSGNQLFLKIDEADQIKDSVLKKVYQLSRRKASA